MATRSSDSRLQILKETPGKQHLHIPGSRLPTYNQVLLCYIAHREKLRLEDSSKMQPVKKLAIKPTINEISLHYNKANIMMVHERTMTQKILALHEDYWKLMKLNPERRLQNPLVIKFREKLSKTMPFWPGDAIKKMELLKKGKVEVEKIAIDEDIAFLKSMITDRTAQYSNQDKTTTSIIRKRINREEQIQDRHENMKKIRIEENVQFEWLETDDENEDTIDSIESTSITTPVRSHRRTLKTGTNVTIPHDVLKSPLLISTCTRNKITPTKMSAIVHALITACNGETSSVNLSVPTAYRYNIFPDISFYEIILLLLLTNQNNE